MPSPSGIFISGTGTDVGKTFVSSLLMSAAHARQWPVQYFKPIQTGTDSDTETVQRLSGCDRASLISPLISLPLPAAPYRAALAEGNPIDVTALLSRLQNFPAGDYLIEGAGGLLVPIAENFTMRDLIRALHLPMIIVASTILGTINHTLLTIEAAQKAEIPIAGIILSGPTDPGLADCLRQFGGIDKIAEVPQLTSPPMQQKLEIGNALFSSLQLQQYFTHDKITSIHT